MGTLIRNGTLVTAGARRVGDVRCREGRIVELGSELEPTSTEEVVDASGQYVFPGGVDPHVHMELPVAGTVSSDDFETGTAAAVAGGTTTILDFVHPQRDQDFLEALEARHADATKAVCDYGLHMAVTCWGDRTAEWMGECVKRGIPSFKIYLAYKDTVGLEDADIVRTLAAAAQVNGLVLVHAEHGDAIEHLRDRLAAEDDGETPGPRLHARSRPSQLEGEATHRASVLAGTTGAALYVVHVTCRESVEAIAAAQKRGWNVRGETCSQYLLLDDSVYDKEDFEGAAYVIAPPIRPAGHQKSLWDALASGTLEAVGTDHCPFTMEQKRLGEKDFRKIPGGAAGIQHRLTLLYQHGVRRNRFDLEHFVDLVSTRPAKIFGLYPRKGAIAVGSDADLVVWDPEASGTISATTDRHRCDRSIYEGFEVQGKPSTVVVNGRIQFQDGDLRVERGAGRFLKRSLS